MMLFVVSAAAASAIAMALLYQPAVDPSRVYYGTDTGAQGLLLGALLALLVRPGPAPRERVASPPWALDVVGALGLAGLVAAFALVHNEIPRLYLWHWPIFVFTRPGEDLPWGTAPTLVLRLALTITVAELSYRIIEAPVRAGAIGRWLAVLRSPNPARRRLRWRGIGVVAGAAAAFLVPVTVSLAVASGPLGEVERAVQPAAPAVPAAASPSPPVNEVTVADPGRAAVAAPGGPIDPATLKNHNLTVLADSVLLGAKASVVEELNADGWNVEYRGRPAWMLDKAAAELAQSGQPVGSVVIVALGYNSLWERDRAR